MKKLIQENGPTQVWLQTWQADGGEEYSAAEPAVMQGLDDWTGQLFNYYLLSGFGADCEGSLDVNHSRYDEIKTTLSHWFADGGLSEVHAHFTEKWATQSNTADDDAFWFTAAWDHFLVDDYEGRAVGFFFARERKTFLSMQGDEPLMMRGLPMQKPEFGCLVIPADSDGFLVFMLEPGNGEKGGSIWSDMLFPFHKATNDAFHAKQFFKMCKAFSDDVLVKEQKQPKDSQVSFLADSLEYASKNREVNFENFKADVLKEPAIIDAFDTYQEKYAEERRWNPPDQFAMTDQTEAQARKFVKSVIKLDKNFHIYVHGNKERIERGFDAQRKLNYYTLWFDAEA